MCINAVVKKKKYSLVLDYTGIPQNPTYIPKYIHKHRYTRRIERFWLTKTQAWAKACTSTG